MNQQQAFRDTIQLAIQRGMPIDAGSKTGLDHLGGMLNRIADGNFSEAKLGRWLGWAQACVVCHGCATLEEMKEINRRWS